MADRYQTLDQALKVQMPVGVNGDYLRTVTYLENQAAKQDKYTPEGLFAISQGRKLANSLLETAIEKDSYIHLLLAERMASALVSAGYNAEKFFAKSSSMHMQH